MNSGKDFHTFRAYQKLKQNNSELTPSMEDYLEMIYRICMEEGYIRINQLAEELHVQAPSATSVVQKLTKLGMLDYEKYGIIQLTEKGKAAGEYLLRRHKILEEFLKKIGIEETLLRDTEMIEHNISSDALVNIDLLNKFLNKNPEIVEKFRRFKKNYYSKEEEK